LDIKETTMGVKTIKQNKIIWHHIDKLDDGSLSLLEDEYKFHPLDIKDVKGEKEESKVDVYDKYIFVVLHFPVVIRGQARAEVMELGIFLGKDYLITVQKGTYKPLRDLYYKLQNSAKYRKSCFGRDSGYLLYRILEILYSNNKNTTSYVLSRLQRLEDEVYSDEIDENTAKRIAYLRQKILSLKRILDPQVEVMSQLSRLKTTFLASELNVYFDDIDDKVDKITNFLDNQKYVLKDLLEVHDSLVTHKTNKVIKILTLFSVALLPLTLLSGIYGMNINLPFSGSSINVWLMFILLLALVVGVISYMKKKKLI
jgi:magnesium transporter